MKPTTLLCALAWSASAAFAHAADGPVAASVGAAVASSLAATEAKQTPPAPERKEALAPAATTREKNEAEAREFVKNYKTAMEIQLEQYK